MKGDNYTIPELKLISHSLGHDLFGSIMSTKLKDKEIPTDFYRNYYQISEHETLDELVEKELAMKRIVFGDGVYHISDKGIDKYIAEVKEMLIFERPSNRTREYVTNRIDFYCEWMGYKFGKDIAQHVFDEYDNFKKGHYLSHTTTDVVHRFKSEIRTLLKTEKNG